MILADEVQRLDRLACLFDSMVGCIVFKGTRHT